MNNINTQNPDALRNVFNRLDTDKSSSISRDEMSAFAEKGGLGKGFGKMAKRALITRQGMSTFDKNGDDSIGFDEFQKGVKDLIPEGASLEQSLKGIDELMAKHDLDKNDSLSPNEIYKGAKAKLTEEGESMVKDKAKIGTRLGITALDSDGDKQISKQELQDLAKSVFPEEAAALEASKAQAEALENENKATGDANENVAPHLCEVANW